MKLEYWKYFVELFVEVINIYFCCTFFTHLHLIWVCIDTLRNELNKEGNEHYLFVWSRIKGYEKKYLIVNYKKTNDFISINTNRIKLETDLDIDDNDNESKTSEPTEDIKMTSKEVNNNHYAYL